MKRFLVLWAAVATAAVVGCQGPGVTAWQTISPGLDKVGLRDYWQATAKDMDLAGGEGLQRLWRLHDGVYCLTTMNRLIALDAATGRVQWAVQVAQPGENVYRPVTASNVSLTEKIPGAAEMVTPQKGSPMAPMDVVVINSSSQVVVIDRKSGKVVRRIDLEYGAGCGGGTDGVISCVGAAGGRYYAVSLQQQVTFWRSWAGADVQAPIECFGGAMYVASVKGQVLCARAGRNAPDPRRRALGGPVSAAMHVDARGCFIPCQDNFLYAFTADLSTKLWDHPFGCGGPLRSPVQVGERTVFQLADGDKFYAINIVDGLERWSRKDGVQVVAAIGKYVYVRDTAGRLLQVDEVMGTVEASASLGALDLFAGNATEPAVYAGWSGGRVVCLKPLSAARITEGMLREPRP
jgi:outer membrane protein assembly factor BamB